MNYPTLLYHLKIIRKLSLIKNKYNSLYKVIKLIENKELKKCLKTYRENVLNEKVKEEIIKKNMDIFKINNDKYYKRNDDLKIINENENKSRNNKNETILNKYKKNIINNTIIEEKNENDEDFNTLKSNNRNNDEEKIFLKGKKKYLYINNKLSLLKKIINKKLDLEVKYNFNLLNDNFKNWFQKTYKYQKPKVNNHNLHSPDMEIRGKKKHIKIKYTRAITSKTSIGSFKSEGKSNSSSIHVKKMRIKNVIVNPSDYLTTTLINNDSNSQKFINKNKKIIIKLLCLLDKIDNINMIFKCFKYWKNNKK